MYDFGITELYSCALSFIPPLLNATMGKVIRFLSFCFKIMLWWDNIQKYTGFTVVCCVSNITYVSSYSTQQSTPFALVILQTLTTVLDPSIYLSLYTVMFATNTMARQVLTGARAERWSQDDFQPASQGLLFTVYSPASFLITYISLPLTHNTAYWWWSSVRNSTEHHKYGVRY